jgi:hypothetical protein
MRNPFAAPMGYSHAMPARIRADGFVDPCIPTLAAKPPSARSDRSTTQECSVSHFFIGAGATASWGSMVPAPCPLLIRSLPFSLIVAKLSLPRGLWTVGEVLG